MKRLPPEATGRPPLTIYFDDRRVAAFAGDTVAAALLGAGIQQTRRSAARSEPRGPFCMMGACFECLVEIDGAANRQACLVAAADGMRVRSLGGRRE